MSDNDSAAVRSGEWGCPEEARRSYLRRRGETAQRIADKLGVSVDRVYAEWRRAERAQIEWMKALTAAGYKPGCVPAAGERLARRETGAERSKLTDRIRVSRDHDPKL